MNIKKFIGFCAILFVLMTLVSCGGSNDTGVQRKEKEQSVSFANQQAVFSSACDL